MIGQNYGITYAHSQKGDLTSPEKIHKLLLTQNYYRIFWYWFPLLLALGTTRAVHYKLLLLIFLVLHRVTVVVKGVGDSRGFRNHFKTLLFSLTCDVSLVLFGDNVVGLYFSLEANPSHRTTIPPPRPHTHTQNSWIFPPYHQIWSWWSYNISKREFFSNI